jgi:hypothetical protein
MVGRKYLEATSSQRAENVRVTNMRSKSTLIFFLSNITVRAGVNKKEFYNGVIYLEDRISTSELSYKYLPELSVEV